MGGREAGGAERWGSDEGPVTLADEARPVPSASVCQTPRCRVYKPSLVYPSERAHDEDTAIPLYHSCGNRSSEIVYNFLKVTKK